MQFEIDGPDQGSCNAVAAQTRVAGTRSRSPRSPGETLLKYIRSGPEGARGVLDGSGWSFCTLFSELSSLNSSLNSFCTLLSEFLSEFLSELLRRSPFLELSSLNSSESHLYLKFPSWKSPFSEFSSTFVPPEVTFLEISGHSLHFSEIYVANYVGHMQVVFLMRLSAGCLYVSC